MPGIGLGFIPEGVIGLLLDVRQHHDGPGEPGRGRGRGGGHVAEPIRREPAFVIDEVLRADAELLEVIRALRAAGRFAGGLHRGKEQRDQDADDGDDDEQLDQGEAGSAIQLRGEDTHIN